MYLKNLRQLYYQPLLTLMACQPEGFAAFKKYIIDGGYYSPEVPGVPIAFTASYLMDNSPVYTKFKINIPN